MKKIISALLAAVFLVLTGCSSNRKDVPITTTSAPKSADMLNITSTGISYAECVKRYYAVLDAVKNKIQILEKEHNKQIESENPEKFFLDENYILTAFDPFVLTKFSTTESFSPNLSEEELINSLSFITDGDSISFKNDGDSKYLLSFVNENSLEEYSVEYSTKDSFRYVLTTETDETAVTNEFLEFRKNVNTYYVQSKTSRLWVQFDSDGNIIYFCCSTLKNGSYGNADSIYPDSAPKKEWITERNRDDYISIHTYENGILTHEDSSSGPWKTLTINESDYQNAFPLK